MEITGVKGLHGADYKVMPDRLVAGTFLLAVGACGGKIELVDARPDDLENSVVENLPNQEWQFK